MASNLQLTKRLEERIEIHPSELDYALETRARMHRAGAPYSVVYPTSLLFPGTYYLHGVDSQWRREYGRVPNDAVPRRASTDGGVGEFATLAPPLVLRLAQRDAVSSPVTGKLQVLLAASKSEDEDDVLVLPNNISYLEAQRRIACVVTGTAAGLPGALNTGGSLVNGTGTGGPSVFGPDNLDRLIAGHCCISPISGTVKASLLEKNVVQLVKNKSGDGGTVRRPIDSDEQVIQLAGQLAGLDLSASYGVPPGLAQTMDVAAQVAVAAGMEALKNAGLVSGMSNDPKEWKLPAKYRDSTGVVYASSFPAMDAAVGEVMRFLQSKTVGSADSMRLIGALRSRLVRASPDRQLSDDDEAAFARLLARANEVEPEPKVQDRYEFDRKFLFRVLVLGNAQLAQLASIRGPNTQTNAACAGTTQAIAMAQDMLISGRAQRVVVVAGDNAAGETLLPWIGCGFSALGAATTEASVEDAACPFDRRRSGLLLGAGGIGMVLETEASTLERQKSCPYPFAIKARLLQTQYSNSAFHGAALDRKHIGEELARFLTDVELLHGISKAEIAQHGVYYSHETSTHASPASSCAGNEIAALRFAFGDALVSKLLIVNTKGFTGHPMGVSFEDVAAVETLLRQTVPPVPNYRDPDEYLGPLKISKGGRYACRYALRFAAGFGSQVAFALYATADFE
jgi:3-oxoacyl-(acyl-carrier-protein) synthase